MHQTPLLSERRFGILHRPLASQELWPVDFPPVLLQASLAGYPFLRAAS